MGMTGEKKRWGRLLFSKPEVHRAQRRAAGGFLQREVDQRSQQAHQTWEKSLGPTESKVLETF